MRRLIAVALGVVLASAIALSAPCESVGRPEWAPAPAVAFSPLPALPQPTASPAPPAKPTPAPRTLTGTASWGPFGGHVVTRLKRGTSIQVCGRLACWSGRSWGYGPAVWTNRIADLDREVFRDICGDPYILGLCKVMLSW